MSLELEQTILGAILLNNLCYSKVLPMEPEVFSDEVHSLIFEEIRRRIDAGQVATFVTMANWWKESYPDNDNYLKSLSCVSASSPAFLSSYAEELRETSNRKRLKDSLTNLLDQLEDESIESVEIAAEAMIGLEAVMNGGGTGSVKTSKEMGAEVLVGMSEEFDIFSTGMNGLDRCMGGGLHSGYTYGFCARKKVGKTVLASTLSHNLNMTGVRHMLICGEMGPKQIHERTMARQIECNSGAFRHKDAHDKFFDKVSAAISDDPGNLLYRNAPGMTFKELKQIMLEAVFKHKCKGVILDYWQLVGGKPARQSTAEFLDEVAQWLANFGRRNGIWVVMMAQLNQDGNTRGSEGLRLACDQCYEIHRDDITQPHAWVEMMDTRYTQWSNIGGAEQTGWIMREHGPWFEDLA